MKTRSELLHDVWWHVYPLGACGAPIRDFEPDQPGLHGPRLLHLVPWLDYAKELGCEGLLLNPIFHSTSHGYDTLDHFRIDPRLGDDAVFDEFMQECTERGLAVLLDGVFNHVDAAHPLVEKGLAEGGWEGHEDIPVLDHSKDEIKDLVTDVMLHWLRRGIAGWRLDVAHEVPHEFWREVIGRVRTEFPEALFLGEIIHGDYIALARESDIDTITQYELWAGIRGSVQESNPFELQHSLGRHATFSKELITQTFVGNHDVVRPASILTDDGAALAAAILLTLPGCPSIYYGDEHAYRGDKKDFGPPDDDLRPVLPDSPAELAQLGWWLYHLHQDLIRIRREHPWIVTGALEVTECEGTGIVYEVTGVVGNEKHTLVATADLGEEQSITVTIDDAEVFSFAAGQR